MEGRWVLMWRRKVGGEGGREGRAGGGGEHVVMETHRGAGEAVAVGGDDSTLTACEQLTTIRYPGTAGHLGERGRERDIEIE